LQKIFEDISPIATTLASAIEKSNFANCISADIGDWQIRRISGGKNNLLYKAYAAEISPALAFKFYLRDRAAHEYCILDYLSHSQRALAPKALYLEEKRFKYPLLVQTWLGGTVTQSPPANEEEWHQLADHYLYIHSTTHQGSSTELANDSLPEKGLRDFRQTRYLPHCLMPINSASSAKEAIENQYSIIAPHKRHKKLEQLLDQFDGAELSALETSTPVLCRCDPNPSNFIRNNDGWISVDWENAGLGDCAFDIADLIMHPAYISVPQSRWLWLLERYCSSSEEPNLKERVQAFRKFLTTWWIFRLSRELYTQQETFKSSHRQLNEDITASDELARKSSIEGNLEHYWQLSQG
jgi:thiamine kinase-like enzyme